MVLRHLVISHLRNSHPNLTLGQRQHLAAGLANNLRLQHFLARPVPQLDWGTHPVVNPIVGPALNRNQDRIRIAPFVGQQIHALTVGFIVLAGGYFVEPTVFSGFNNDMKIARGEIFGPVISVIPFEDSDEALRLANATDYGLGGAVWTQNVSCTRRSHTSTAIEPG